MQIVSMKCQILLSGKNNMKNTIILYSAVSVHSLLSVKYLANTIVYASYVNRANTSFYFSV